MITLLTALARRMGLSCVHGLAQYGLAKGFTKDFCRDWR